MENINEILAENILKYRKKSNMTQEEVADQLGVSFQAVSKWENKKAAPDIAFLPRMAELFDCSIDALFSREGNALKKARPYADLPWEDDNVIRVFQAVGRKIMKAQEGNTCLEVTFPKNCNETTRQYFKVEVFGNLMCDSSINGDVICHGKLECHQINGDVTAQGPIKAYEINCCGKVICP